MRGLISSLLILADLGACATVPTRPSEILPLVEVEVNNTPTHRDDIVSIFSSVQVPGRMRITNPQGALSGVQQDYPVVLRNIGPCGSYCGELRFAAGSAGPFVSTLPLTLPRSGAWVPFLVRGNPNRASQTAKDAVLEVRENIARGNVLARQGLFVGDMSAVLIHPRAAIVEINGTAITLDDYLTWAPTRATVRLATPNVGGPLTILLRNAAPAPGADPAGRVVFGLPTSGGPPAAGTMTPTLTITLPANGYAVEFYAAGEFSFPSQRDKDAIIEVVNPTASNAELALLENIGVMVRIRKDANGLTPTERTRLLNVIGLTTGQYDNYVQIEAQAGSRAHTVSPTNPSPAFLPWHRTLLLRFERQLQGLDPSVALPYWRYDAPAPNVFTKDFMGESQSSANLPTVLTAPSNPLSSWSIQRMSSFPPSANPTSSGPSACWTASEANILGPSTTQFINGLSGFWRLEEVGNHRAIEAASGQCVGFTSSWLAQPANAARDPLFFLLHANTDRLWAKWQRLKGRFDPSIADSYGPSTCVAAGQCLTDTMWPWNTPSSPGGNFAEGLGRWLLPPSSPMPGNVLSIDRSYIWFAGSGQWQQASAGLGYSYDDTPSTP